MTSIIAGIDVGNSTTEVAIAQISSFQSPPAFLGAAGFQQPVSKAP